MARKKKVEQDEAAMENEALAGLLDAQQARLGSVRMYAGDDLTNNMTGVRLPGLCLEWLLGMDVWPARKVMFIAGESQAMKSTLGFEVNRWLLGAGGIGQLHETEGDKVSDLVARGLMGPAYRDRVRFQKLLTTTVEEAQQAWTSLHAYIVEKGITRRPVFAQLDSLSGVETESAGEKLDANGYASGQAYPEAAKAWGKYLKQVAVWALDGPFFYHLINHLKDDIAQMPTGGPPVKRTPGGKQQRFTASCYIWLKRIDKGARQEWEEPTGEILGRFHEYRTIQMLTDKNTFGPDGRRIEVDFLAWREPDGGQCFRWDWPSADARWLSLLQQPDCKYADRKRVRGICDVDVSKNRYSSRRLDLQGVSARRFGAALRADQDLCNELRDALGIVHCRAEFGPDEFGLPDPTPVPLEEQGLPRQRRSREAVKDG